MIHFFIVYRVYVVIFLVFISSCMTKDTQILSENEYPFKEFVEKQSKFLSQRGLKKTMWLNNKEKHPHQNPYELQKTLISCVSDERYIIGYFAGGSFSILDACKEINRTFIGCRLIC